MAIYYVRNDGNDANTGLGSTTALAWKTVQKALGATGISSGDTVYIAPGVYRENIVIAGTYTAPTYIIGDPTAAQFAGVAQGLVRLTNYLTTDTASPSGTIMSSGNKNYLNISYLYFDGSAVMLTLGTSNNTSIENCAFIGSSLTASSGIQGNHNTGVTVNNTIRRCIFMTGSYGIFVYVGGNHTSDWSIGYTVQDCAFIGASPVTSSSPAIWFSRNTGVSLLAGGINIYNCYIQSAVQGIAFDCGNPTYPTNVRNCIITNCGTAIVGRGTTTNIQDYNRIIGCATTLTNVATGANTVTVGPLMVDIGMSQLFGLSAKQTWFSALPSSLNIGFGDPTGALTTDLFGSTWFNGGSDPDVGALTSIQLSNTSYYQPTERNASTITIAPGSTSQSIELYLGATGLTASTSGLSARYNRTRTASVSIPLVARTIAQAWTAGGFAEVDATNMPGVYRLDVPDAALASGADDVTIVVRGAAGTNGAVMTIKLSSGGLSSTETAQAVWNATASSYNTAGSMGEAGQKLTGYSLASSQTFSTTGSVGSVTGSVGSVTGSVGSVTGSVGSVTGAVGSVSSAVTVGTNNDKTGYALSSAGNTASADAVWNATRSTHTTAGTFGQYVNAELVTPVTGASTVHMGPFEVKADGLGADAPLDVQKGAQHGIDIQCVDGNGVGIDITGATVTAKVYNAGGSLVDTYSCTATYADDGRATFTIDTTVTGTAGTYTATITRTTGASDTQVFGPLRIYVRDI